MDNQIENLRFDVDRRARAPQLLLIEINLEIRKTVSHYYPKSRLAGRLIETNLQQWKNNVS